MPVERSKKLGSILPSKVEQLMTVSTPGRDPRAGCTIAIWIISACKKQ